MAVRIVTDSNADVPPDLTARLGIVVVPSILNLEGQSLRDNVEITRSQFYQRLRSLKELPTTAAPSVGDFEAAYAECGPADIVAITLAAKLSAIHNAARLAGEPLGERFTLIDSGSLSMGLGWQVVAAAEAAAAGQSVSAIVEKVADVRRRLKVMAVLDTLENLRRGGRASTVTAVLGQMLQIKPILELRDGEVLPLARPRTRARGVEQLVELITALGPLERLAVLHADCAAEAQALAERLAPRSAEAPLVIELTSVIGVHLGPCALGAAAVKAA